MAEFTARPEFRGEWVEQVKQIIDNKKSVANAGKFPRVATPLLDAKPEAYIPNFVSLGPYHHWKLEQKIAVSSSAGDNYEYRKLKMSSAEAYKVESAATFWRNRRKRLDDIIEKMKGMRQDIEEFYDWPISADSEYAKQFALMMAIDSSFLLRFLFSQSGSFEDGMKNLTRLQVSITCDILKLENQIPLSILSSLFDIAKEDLNDAGRHEEFSKLLQQTYKELSPFEQFDIANSDPKTEINKQPHLLGCVHAFVSPLLDMKVIGEDNVSEHILFHRLQQSLKVLVATVFPLLDVKLPSIEGRHYHHYLNLINAGELRNGGIKFKSFSKQPNVGKLEKGGSHRGGVGIRFDKYSGTLYLPQITVSEMQTEVFFRNMLALEFNDAARGDSVTRYVGLMDCLIDTPEDVRLLRESQVILRGSVTLTDEKIAAMWNGLCHPIFTGHLEPPEDLNGEIGEVLISKHHRKVIREFYWDHLSEPVKDLALLVGKCIALLIGIRLLRRTLVRLLERAIGNLSVLLFKRPFGTLHQLLDMHFGRSLPVIFKFKTATRISKRP